MSKQPNTSISEFCATVGLMMTYRCTIACAHCIVKAGPNRTEEISEEEACKWLDELSNYGNKTVKAIAFTGGEPFYNIPLLKKVTDYAGELGFVVTVVTNGYWASSQEKALQVMCQLQNIDVVAVSADVYHQQHIPIENVKNAIFAAQKLGKAFRVSLSTRKMEDPEYLSLKEHVLSFISEEDINTAIIIEAGRAENDCDTEAYTNDPSTAACDMASFPVIFPTGDVIACIGPPITLPHNHPLYLGNLRKEKVKRILDRSKGNRLLHAIRAFGPIELIDLLKTHGYEKLLPKQYLPDSNCDVCLRLFRNPEICHALNRIAETDDFFAQKVFAGCKVYFDEELYELL